jgi:hypothetical protein
MVLIIVVAHHRQVRDGRMLRTRTINNNNNPEFDEEFTMLVDNINTQVIKRGGAVMRSEVLLLLLPLVVVVGT